MALITSESITLMVKGTCASELRTRFWPTRFTYSVITGSFTSFTCASTCCAKRRPMATWPSTLYQLPTPRPQPTLRLPTASTSVFPPLCLIWLSSWEGNTTGGLLAVSGVFWTSPALGWSLSGSETCADVQGTALNAANATVIANQRNFMGTPLRLLLSTLYARQGTRILNFSLRLDAPDPLWGYLGC